MFSLMVYWIIDDSTFQSQQAFWLQAHSSSVKNPMLSWLRATEQE